jgi:hypothetical protein
MQKAAGINYSNSLRAVAACRLALVSSLRARAFVRFFHFFHRRSLSVIILRLLAGFLPPGTRSVHISPSQISETVRLA